MFFSHLFLEKFVAFLWLPEIHPFSHRNRGKYTKIILSSVAEPLKTKELRWNFQRTSVITLSISVNLRRQSFKYEDRKKITKIGKKLKNLTIFIYVNFNRSGEPRDVLRLS